MEVITLIISSVLGGSAIGVVVGIFTFKSRVKKVRNEAKRDSNETTRDGLELNQEVLKHIKELSTEIADLTAKYLKREREFLVLKSTNEIQNVKIRKLETLHQKEMSRLRKLKKITEYYKAHCSCRIELPSFD